MGIGLLEADVAVMEIELGQFDAAMAWATRLYDADLRAMVMVEVANSLIESFLPRLPRPIQPRMQGM